VVISTNEIREAMEEPVATIIDTVKATLDQTPPELSADIMERGITLAGGGSLLVGLPERLRAETGMPVWLAPDPLLSVVIGAGMALDHLDAYGDTVFGDGME
jgi:rod shape-determining protein MreB